MKDTKEKPNQKAKFLRDKITVTLKPMVFGLLIGVALAWSQGLGLAEKIEVAEEEVVVSPPVSIPLPPNPRKEFAFKDIFFEFNRYDIRDDAKPVLRENAWILKYNSDLSVVIEGYCDSGDTVTVEDNLGKKRAQAAKDYLITLGIEPQRMQTLDKCGAGERSLENNEKVWGLDRRVHFILETTRPNGDSII